MPTAALAGRTALVLTASDRCASRTQTDLSGPAVEHLLHAAGATLLPGRIVPDDHAALVAALRDAALHANLVVTTGGTGLGPRDVTPEATLAVCSRLVPGLAELLRAEGVRQTPFAALGRGVCGVCGTALLVNLPGSPAAAESSLRVLLPLLPHALDLLAGQTAHPASNVKSPSATQ